MPFGLSIMILLAPCLGISSLEGSSKRDQVINLTLLHWEHSFARQDQHTFVLLSWHYGVIVIYTRRDSNSFILQDSSEKPFLSQRSISVKETGIETFPFLLMKNKLFIFYRAVQFCG